MVKAADAVDGEVVPLRRHLPLVTFAAYAVYGMCVGRDARGVEGSRGPRVVEKLVWCSFGIGVVPLFSV